MQLLHPFYLDTDMSMAFAAAIAGGIAIEQEDVERGATASKAVRNIEGNLRVFGKLGLGGRRGREESEEAGVESRLLRQHTEASIFISLHDELRRTGRLNELKIDELSPGDLVSVELGPAVAPLRRVVDQIVRLLELAAPMLGAADSGHAVETAGMTRQQRRALQREAAKRALAASDGDGGAQLRQMYTMFVALQDDLDQSGIIDVVVSRDDAPSVVMTLDKRFADDHVIELLHSSKFRVVGKVTQILPTEDDVLNLYRRSVMALMPALTEMSMWGMLSLLAGVARAVEGADFETTAKDLAGVVVDEPDNADGSEGPSGEDAATTGVENKEEGEIRFGEIEALTPAVTGPAVQILPLAICA